MRSCEVTTLSQWKKKKALWNVGGIADRIHDGDARSKLKQTAGIVLSGPC